MEVGFSKYRKILQKISLVKSIFNTLMDLVFWGFKENISIKGAVSYIYINQQRKVLPCDQNKKCWKIFHRLYSFLKRIHLWVKEKFDMLLWNIYYYEILYLILEMKYFDETAEESVLESTIVSSQLTFTCSSSTIETLEKGVRYVKVNSKNIVNLEPISDLVLVSLLLTLNK